MIGGEQIFFTEPAPQIEGEFKQGDIIVSREQIMARTKELAQEIVKHYKGKELVVIADIEGGAFFGVDLFRALYEAGLYDSQIAFMGTAKYPSGHPLHGQEYTTHELNVDITDREVLVVNDIHATGIDLTHLTQYLGARHPKSLHSAYLLSKPASCRQKQIEPTWVGFHVPDVWIDGGGMNSFNRFGAGNPNVIMGPNPLSPKP